MLMLPLKLIRLYIKCVGSRAVDVAAFRSCLMVFSERGYITAVGNNLHRCSFSFIFILAFFFLSSHFFIFRKVSKRHQPTNALGTKYRIWYRCWCCSQNIIISIIIRTHQPCFCNSRALQLRKSCCTWGNFSFWCMGKNVKKNCNHNHLLLVSH